MDVTRKHAGAPRARKKMTQGALRKVAAKAARRARAGRAVALPPSLELGATEFKAICLQLMDEVHRTGKSVVITKRGKPVAQLGPPPATPKPRSPFGGMAGKGKILGDIVSPAIPVAEQTRLLDEEWDEFERKTRP